MVGESPFGRIFTPPKRELARPTVVNAGGPASQPRGGLQAANAQQPDDEVLRRAASAPPPRNPAARQSYAQAFFMGMGWSPVQASAIVGAGMQESGSGLNPNAVGDNGTAHGIFQWRGDRLDNLKAFAKRNNADWRDFDTQLRFADFELRNNEVEAGRRLKGAQNVEQAAFAMAGFERPRGWQGWENTDPAQIHGWSNRLAFAQRQLGVATSFARGNEADVDVTDQAAYRRWLDGLEAGQRGAVEGALGGAGQPMRGPGSGDELLGRAASRDPVRTGDLRTRKERLGDILGGALSGLGAGSEQERFVPELPNFAAAQQMFEQQAQSGPLQPLGSGQTPQLPRLGNLFG
ncbi:phage tail tip lysozyme [Chelativorans xinjiangense]|uniref:phage tail tip lysozyme n=1 Tax=Chelativorans xinjiangense TaxID=2681485 RepID=UPI0024834E7B|nr:phage tail tip lysozyme [Chelativorans xinjiangense]